MWLAALSSSMILKTCIINLKFLQNAVGAVPGPQDCWLTMRGIKTLHLRMERHCENAIENCSISWPINLLFSEVIYPGLDSHPQHELAQRSKWVANSAG